MPEAPTNYTPAGYCRCGYRTDPGKCPECGRTNRRMRRWNPKGRIRWWKRAVFALAAAVALFFAARYAMWNWWPLEHLQDLASIQFSESTPFADKFQDWVTAVLDYRARKMFDFANARWKAFAARPQGPNDWEGRYADAANSVAAYMYGDEFLIAIESGPFRQGPGHLDLYGKIIGRSHDHLSIAVKFTEGPGGAAPVRSLSPFTLDYVRALVDGEPLLIQQNAVVDAWQHFRRNRHNFSVRYTAGSRGFYLQRFARPPDPDRAFFVPSFKSHELLLPAEYCAQVWRPLIVGTVIQVSPAEDPPRGSLDFDAVLNVGARHGVKQDTLFYLDHRHYGEVLSITSLEDSTCTVSPDRWMVAEAHYWPEIGAVLHSVSDEE